MLSALIFAAGRGERLQPLTLDTPKPMLYIHDKPILEYHLLKLKKAGFQHVFINHAYLGYKIKHYFGDGSALELKIEYLAEPSGGLETGGTLAALMHLKKIKSEYLLTINADIFTEYCFKQDIELATSINGHLVLIPQSKDYPQASFDLDDKQSIHCQPQKFVFSGIAYYRTKALQNLPLGRFSIRDWLFEQANNGALTGEVYHGLWQDIGDKERLQRLTLQTLQKV
jgi:MurNAc alpha-1-phosphate uridylyltransferase